MKPVFASLALMLFAARLAAGEADTNGTTIYHSDPTHLWNRLNDALFIRTAPDGKTYGAGEVDILFFATTKHLLTEPSHQQAMAVLDEFISDHGENLIHDPLRRALLQRDLWELFDWSAQDPISYERERRELQNRLAVLIHRLALTTNEIASLPDNYALAAADRSFTNLPHGLFQTNGDWVSVGINGADLAAQAHVIDFRGRSAFLVLFRHPGGRTAAIDYLRRLRSVTPMWIAVTNFAVPSEPARINLNPALPQFPPNSEWVLVRRMLLIDADGNIRPTPITETLQFRRYLKIADAEFVASSNRHSLKGIQHFGEFQMRRGRDAALTEISPGVRGFVFVQFRGMGIDFFEPDRPNEPVGDSSRLKHEMLGTCITCHGSAGILSVNSFTRSFTSPPILNPPGMADLSIEREIADTIAWKHRRYEWGLLEGLWRERLP